VEASTCLADDTTLYGVYGWEHWVVLGMLCVTIVVVVGLIVYGVSMAIWRLLDVKIAVGTRVTVVNEDSHFYGHEGKVVAHCESDPQIVWVKLDPLELGVYPAAMMFNVAHLSTAILAEELAEL
jgi:hypothetical protein